MHDCPRVEDWTVGAVKGMERDTVDRVESKALFGDAWRATHDGCVTFLVDGHLVRHQVLSLFLREMDDIDPWAALLDASDAATAPEAVSLR